MIGVHWCARWAIKTPCVAVLLCAVSAFTIPAVRNLGAPACIALLTGLAVLMAAITVLAEQPRHRAYVQALGALDSTGRTRAIQATWRGPIPTKPSVLAAAIRLSRRLTRDGHPPPAWRKHALGVAAALWALAAIVEFWAGDPRRGTGWALFTVLYTAITVKDRYVARRLRTRLDMLQASSESSPEALQALTEPAVPVAISARRRALIAAAVVAAVAAGGTAAGYAQHLEYTNCRTAYEALTYLREHWSLTDPGAVLPGGPELHTYRQWAAGLKDYAAQTSAASTVTPRLRRLAGLAEHAVLLVEKARGTSDPTVTAQFQREFLQLIKQMSEDSTAAVTHCRDT
ncbi:hypothetical protein CCUG60885_00416 [Mycobacteroides salmoniphilum]|uniref:Uncharacterized protein n=2 Tax=Mycobacteroides salmoniphilum TaxID=404941 RepID=A0A4R8SLG7_9MYCO|nr:hypothetical protein CCUG60885_00416 [Mycobacteroides salmoniphilum]TEA03076.1 hypothetical protein CCUG60883_03700 [Mycobacteroides salmoniphilum]